MVDPIDGTRAFLAGNPDWSVALGLLVDGEPVRAGSGEQARVVVRDDDGQLQVVPESEAAASRVVRHRADADDPAAPVDDRAVARLLGKQRAERVARQAFGVDAHERHVITVGRRDEREVLGAVDAASVYVPLAETRVQLIAGQRLRNGVVMRP